MQPQWIREEKITFWVMVTDSNFLCLYLQRGKALEDIGLAFLLVIFAKMKLYPLLKTQRTKQPCFAVYVWNTISLYMYLEKAMASHSGTLAWKIPWMEEPGRLQSMGSLRVRHDFTFTFTFHFHALEKEMATHSSVLPWRIPGTGELGGLPSMGLHRVGHDWSDLAVYMY